MCPEPQEKQTHKEISEKALKSEKKLAYNYMALQIHEYSSTVWPRTQENTTKLESEHQRTTRFVKNKYNKPLASPNC